MLKPSFFQEYSLTSSTGFRGASIDSLLALRGGDAPLPPPVPSRFDPLVQKFLPGYEQHPNVIAALILAFALRPAAKMYYEHLSSMIQSKLSSITGKTLDTTTAPPQNNNEPFEGSTFNKVVETIVEAARLFILIAAFDIFNTILGCLGLRLPKSETLTDAFGLAVFFLWGFRRLGRFKFYVLKKTMVHTDLINDPRRLFFINRLMDYALVFLGIFAFYEILNVEMGYSAKSLVAAFSFGTAAIALSTKEIITNFLNGVILSASDRIFVGDIISIQGEVKKVNNLGWLETKLRGSDNILYTVPNTELVSTKLSNLSRVQTCQGRSLPNCISRLRFTTNVISSAICSRFMDFFF